MNYYQAGKGLNVYRGPVMQRGYGLGGTFRKFFNWIVPIVQKHALPAVESGLREVGRTAVSTVADIAKDTVAGRSIKEASEEHINRAVNQLKEKVENKLEGRGKKRKTNKKKIILIKKNSKKFDDIFNKYED
jgi:hypothetical protein